MTESKRYDVALSFAGENRGYVDKVAAVLKDAGVKIFYDDYEKATLWGKDLYTHLDWVYSEASRYCVMFISESYAKKVWTNHERKSAQARALQENNEYVLPARFDDTVIPGVRSTLGYLEIADMSPQELAEIIQEKLGPRPLTPGFPRKTDRLYKALGLKGSKAKPAKKEAWNVGMSFWEVLSRMTVEERKVVGGVMAFGCPGELPAGVHVSLDLLSRMVKMPHAQILDALANVKSLNVKVQVRDAAKVHRRNDGELVGDDKDLLVNFWSPWVPGAKDPTRVVYEVVQQASDHYCPDHGLQALTALDFHGLSSAELGPRAMDDVDV